MYEKGNTRSRLTYYRRNDVNYHLHGSFRYRMATGLFLSCCIWHFGATYPVLYADPSIQASPPNHSNPRHLPPTRGNIIGVGQKEQGFYQQDPAQREIDSGNVTLHSLPPCNAWMNGFVSA